jgi:AraC family transcriptional regulator, regulatory protein of adaptative response / methylated-DNA-[protein]-cysteine methyltransferase
MITETLAVASASIPNASSARWQSILSRDLAADGRFVYAVTTTGIYCRPTCPSRRPRPEHVLYFGSGQEASRAGYRACRRCRPDEPVSPAIARVERVRRWIETHGDDTPVLSKLSRIAGLSPWHLQRSFSRLYGVSPREYAAARRVERLKVALQSGAKSADAVYEAGYGSPSRAYEAAAGALGMTPRAYREGGDDSEIRYAIASSGVGRVLVASTLRGLCRVALGDNDAELTASLAREFPHAHVVRDDDGLERTMRVVIGMANGQRARDIPLDVRGTVFQQRVWKALRQIPRGTTKTYAEVAADIGRPSAARAVARACATNPLALVVPCHRVVPAAGGLGGYRWGTTRKARLLQQESGRPSRT